MGRSVWKVANNNNYCLVILTWIDGKLAWYYQDLYETNQHYELLHFWLSMPTSNLYCYCGVIIIYDCTKLTLIFKRACDNYWTPIPFNITTFMFLSIFIRTPPVTFESKFVDAYPDLYQRLRNSPRGTCSFFFFLWFWM